MQYYHSSRWLISIFAILLLVLAMIEGKGFGGGRGGGGFKGGSKGSESFGGQSNYGRVNSYGSNNMGKPRTGSSLGSKASSFAAGAVGGIAAYSIMRSMSGGHRYRSDGNYGPGYSVGETCVNNEDMNGTVFGQFRCPLPGFPMDAKYCCGEYGDQYCCARDTSGRFSRNASHFGWIVLVIAILLICIIFWARRNRQRQKDLVMIPTEPPMNEPLRPSPFYQPPPPAAGYPPPPGVNPYAVPPQNFNSYAQKSQPPYPPQQHSYNPY